MSNLPINDVFNVLSDLGSCFSTLLVSFDSNVIAIKKDIRSISFFSFFFFWFQRMRIRSISYQEVHGGCYRVVFLQLHQLVGVYNSKESRNRESVKSCQGTILLNSNLWQTQLGKFLAPRSSFHELISLPIAPPPNVSDSNKSL